jgi:carbonic anhydrase/acetyltransferase-like protein (isoleucine patch superfamily)
MRKTHRFASLGAGLVALLLIAPAHGLSLNKSIKVDAGSQTGGQSSVNGSISVGEGAVIDGSLETVNGSIRVDENVTLEDAETVNGTIRIASGSSADDVSSVNGAIRLGENVTVAGEIEVVNGKISLDTGTKVARDVSNVNGDISLTGAEVGGDLSTVNGDVSLDNGSTLRGDLIVEKPSGWSWKSEKSKPRIVIGADSKVLGNIVLKREVELYISNSAEVGGVTGEMSMDDAVRFSGDSP